MPEYRVDQIDKGEISDIPSYKLPDGAWVKALNTRFRNGKIQPRPGYREIGPFAFPDTVNYLGKFVEGSTGSEILVAGTKRDLAQYLATIYSTGTATTTNGSADVTLSAGADLIVGTVEPGDIIRFKDAASPNGTYQKYYLIKSVNKVNGAAALTLTTTISEASVAGADYQIKRLFRYITPRHTTQTLDVTNGSALVKANSVPAGFTNVKAGDFIEITGAVAGAYHKRWYEVLSVNVVPAPDELTLTQNYEGTTGTGLTSVMRNTFIGADEDRWQSALCAEPPNPPTFGTQRAKMIFVNLKNNAQKWDGAAVTVEQLGDPVNFETKARYCIYVANHLVLARMASNPYTMRWSDYANPDQLNFDIAASSGGGEVSDDAKPITGLQKIHDRFVVCKPDLLQVFAPTGTLPAFRRENNYIGRGNELEFATTVSENTVFFVDMDGIYTFDLSAPRNIAEGIVWQHFKDDFAWGKKQFAFSFYSAGDRELYLFYPSATSTDNFPDKALVLNVDTGAFSTWEIKVTAVEEFLESVGVTIDTIEDLFDWGPPKNIDTMPWASIDSIGTEGDKLRIFISSTDKKVHNFGSHYSDNGTVYRKFLQSKLYDFGDAEQRKMLRFLRLLAAASGGPDPIRLKIRSTFDIIDPPVLRGEWKIYLTGGRSLKANARAPGRWYEFSIESNNLDELWELWGFSVDLAMVGRRDAVWLKGTLPVGISSSQGVADTPASSPLQPPVQGIGGGLGGSILR